MRLNPMTAPIEVFRMGTLGTGTVEVGSLIYSLIVTAAALVLGVVLFSRIEKNLYGYRVRRGADGKPDTCTKPARTRHSGIGLEKSNTNWARLAAAL